MSRANGFTWFHQRPAERPTEPQPIRRTRYLLAAGRTDQIEIEGLSAVANKLLSERHAGRKGKAAR